MGLINAAAMEKKKVAPLVQVGRDLVTTACCLQLAPCYLSPHLDLDAVEPEDLDGCRRNTLGKLVLKRR
jgi:hypothetical protein